VITTRLKNDHQRLTKFLTLITTQMTRLPLPSIDSSRCCSSNCGQGLLSDARRGIASLSIIRGNVWV